MFCILKKKESILPMFQNITQIVKNKLFFNNSKREGWHYLAVKNLSALLIGISSKHKSNFYCLTCLHSFRTKNKKSIRNKDFCNIVMPPKDT